MSGRAYSAVELCREVGITYRQLDYWARTHLLTPSVTSAHGQGSARRYSDTDVAKARSITALLDVGVSLAKARAAMPLVADALADGLRFLVIGGGVLGGLC